MQTFDLTDRSINWAAVVATVNDTAEPVVLAIHGTICGLLLPEHTARQLVARMRPAKYQQHPVPTAQPLAAQNYLELLRDDPTLVPIVDGQPLEFVTMMNSSYIDPQQLYQFKHPATHRLYIYRASELQSAIGRVFVSVDFVPNNPKAFVTDKHSE